MPDPTTQPDPSPKTPPDPQKIKALLDMAAMQSHASMGHRPPYKKLGIVCVVLVIVMVGAYIAVTWAAHHY